MRDVLSEYSQAMAEVGGEFSRENKLKHAFDLHPSNVCIVIHNHLGDFFAFLFLSAFQVFSPWYWAPNKILHFNRDDVIGTVLSTDFTIAVLPSMVVTRFELQTMKLRHGEGPIVPPEPENINAAVLERGEEGP